MAPTFMVTPAESMRESRSDAAAETEAPRNWEGDKREADGRHE
jgi:hypothetical protein